MDGIHRDPRSGELGGGGVAPDNRAWSSAKARSLLVIVVDVSPLAWGERDLQRTAQDKARLAQNKRTVGPATLREVLESLAAFCAAFVNCEPGGGMLAIMGVADGQSALLYPRQNVLGRWLDDNNPGIGGDSSCDRPDLRQLRSDLFGGAAELLKRASDVAQTSSTPASRQASIASALSSGMCLINRFLVASRGAGAVTGLSLGGDDRYLSRTDDQGIVALMAGASKMSGRARGGQSSSQAPSGWAPRILVVQASDDRSQDYNAVMNCAFAAAKNGIVIDGCFLARAAASSSAGTSSSSNSSSSSPLPSSSSAFLEQACDLTLGIFLAPSGAAQADGALTEVLVSVFLPPVACRSKFNLPSLAKVDFRARCFETAEIVDRAYVCNLCLSIFRDRPPAGTPCPTCEATILVGKRRRS